MTSQNCAECGTRAEPGQSFCEACGAVLSWTVTEPVAPADHEPTVPHGRDEERSTERAHSLLVPVADPQQQPRQQATPVLPGRPLADRPQVRAPAPEPGDVNGLPCPWCETSNRPDRNFCVRCAMPMTRRESLQDEPRPWWRRLLNSPGETPWAGDRPGLRRAFDRVLTFLMAAVALTLLIVLAVQAPDAVQATRDHFAKRAPLAPDRVTASRFYPAHKPELLFDKHNNTWWGPGVDQSAKGEWIEAHFDEPTRLLDLIITPGVSAKADKLSESALPHRLRAAITTKDGKTTTRSLNLDQGPGGQRRPFRAQEVIKIRFTIESAYATATNKQVAIAEIELFGPSASSIF